MSKSQDEASSARAAAKDFQASRRPGITLRSGSGQGSAPDLKRPRPAEATWHRHVQLEIGVKIGR